VSIGRVAKRAGLPAFPLEKLNVECARERYLVDTTEMNQMILLETYERR
jgi:hypothetical protein